jgi:hypothetical protein
LSSITLRTSFVESTTSWTVLRVNTWILNGMSGFLGPLAASAGPEPAPSASAQTVADSSTFLMSTS